MVRTINTISKLGLLCAVWITALGGIAARADEAPEYQVKAAFLYNFAKFVEWPSDALPQDSSPFIIGVLGDDPFGANLDKTVEGKALGEHKIVAKRFKKLEDVQTCHRSEKDKMSKIVERLGKANTLIVGDTDQLLQRGGAINFTLEDKKVRFEINADAAERADLKVSSKLMQLATKVIHH